MNIRRITRRVTMGFGVGAILLAGLTACGTDNKRDLKNVHSLNPDYAEIYNNTDGHPNIGLICVRGVGFATTTRDYNAIQRVPAWDKFCTQFPQHSILTKQEGSR